MAKRQWVWAVFGEQEHILVDNRFDLGVPSSNYVYNVTNNVVYLEAAPKHTWTPLLVLKHSERFTWEEFKAYAQVLTDRLNAYEVEQVLKGDG